MTRCPRCGRPTLPHQGCPCGQWASTPPSARTPAAPVQRLLPAAVVAFAALLTLFWAFLGLPSSGGVLVLLMLLPALAVPVVLGVVAAGLARGRRLARAATALLVPLLGVTALTTTAGGGLLLAGALLCGGASVALVLVPDLRAHVAADQPRIAPSISLVRLVLTVFASCSALAAVVSTVLLVGGLIGMSAVAGAGTTEESSLLAGVTGLVGATMAGVAAVVLVIHGGLAALGFWARGALARHQRVARILVTVAVSLGLLVLIALGVSAADGNGTGGALLGVLVALHVAVLVLLWVPSDARVHFGDRPVEALDDLRRQLVAATSGRPSTHPGSLGGGWAATSFGPTAGAPAPGTPPLRPGPGPRPTARSSWPPAPAPSHPSTPRPPATSFTSFRSGSDVDATTVGDRDGLNAPTTRTSPHPAVPARPGPATNGSGPVGAAAVVPSARACAGCGGAAEPGWSHCPRCGARLDAGAPHLGS